MAQWADAHNAIAQAWVSADSGHGRYVNKWAEAHPKDVTQFVKDNPGIPKPVATDLAIVFFKSFSKENPGKYPGLKRPGTAPGWRRRGHPIHILRYVATGQSQLALQEVPGDMVTTSASGLDPHISLENAEFQLDRVASKWALLTHRDQARVRAEIQSILDANELAPLQGLVGEKIVNVLEVNFELNKRFKAVL